MKREIFFSKNAEKSLIELLEYLEFKWSIKVRDKFISKLEKSIYLIQNEPEIFSKSTTNTKIQKCVVTKQTTLFYTHTTKKINVVAFFDTRQNPNKLKDLK